MKAHQHEGPDLTNKLNLFFFEKILIFNDDS
jgi:hypothetical protein